MNGRHAYLIMAHNEWPILNTLLKLIDDSRNDIYLHIDKKVNPLPELYKVSKANLYFTPTRIDVRWGDFSQIQTELLLYKTAVAKGPYQYYHLLSGVDLPLKTQDYIHNFFNENYDKEFIGFFTDSPMRRQSLQQKIGRYYLFTRLNARTTFVPKIILRFAQVVRHSFLWIQDKLHFERGHELDFMIGHNWASLTDDAVKYLLTKESFINKRFKRTFCADEIYKHSILFSSPFKEKIYDLENGRRSCMRFIDFERVDKALLYRGEPYIWQDKDYDELMSSPYLFARKFTTTNMAVINSIAEALS